MSFMEDLKDKNTSFVISSVISAVNSLESSSSANLRLALTDFKWLIGNGESILFWLDSWHEDGMMTTLFPKLFQLSTLKNASLSNFVKIISSREGTKYTLWNRSLRHWEKDEVAKLLAIVNKVILNNFKDQLIWKPSGKPFKVSDCYSLLMENQGTKEKVYRLLWSMKAPPKVLIFLWLMSNKALPTSQLIKNRLNRFQYSDVCVWCKNSEDNQDHILWHCEPAKWGWSFVESWWEVKVFETNLWSSMSFFKSPSVRMAWGAVLAATLWTIWLFRNQCVFEGKKHDRKSLVNLILIRTLSWYESLNLIQKEKEHVWRSNPVGLVLACSKYSKKQLCSKISQLFCFIDGAWDQNHAGIGGFIQDSEDNLLFIFSGPVQGDSILASEIYESLVFLLENIFSSQWSDSKVMIFSDNQELVDVVQGINFLRKISWPLDDRFLKIASNLNFELKKVNRFVNGGADFLAGQGARRGKMLKSWC